jgi:hypothetical protein
VSTVFLGLDHRYGEEPPLIFETMIFGRGFEYQERCSTWDEAVAMHDRACEVVRARVRSEWLNCTSPDHPTG